MHLIKFYNWSISQLYTNKRVVRSVNFLWPKYLEQLTFLP